MKKFRIALAQINSVVGDLNGNKKKIIENIKKAEDKGCNLIAFPELTLMGYPPEDLLLRSDFIDENMKIVNELAKYTTNIITVVGFVNRKKDIFNSAAVLYDKEIKGIYNKIYLPNYGVFDERRYFQQGEEVPIFNLNGFSIGISICEDIWYPEGPATIQAANGAEVLVNINASPYFIEKWKIRQQMLSTRAADTGAYLVWVNMVGGQDELLFDGYSMIISPGGELISSADFYKEDLLISDIYPEESLKCRLHDPRIRAYKLKEFSYQYKVVYYDMKSSLNTPKTDKIKNKITPTMGKNKEIYEAIVFALKDYVEKNNFKKVILGLSGGIDSALTASIAVDALGSKNVKTLFLPSKFSSKISKDIACEIAKKLKIELDEISIENIYNEYSGTLKKYFKDTDSGITFENIQARIRGNILMAYSNKYGYLVLTTGNKSEMAVGYSTLYGDMAGGFSVLKDVFKTQVYELARYRNKISSVFPEKVFTRPPTAELKEGQTDEEALCPYPILDGILKAYIEDDRSVDEIISLGYKAEIVKRIIKLVDMSEYKRRQAPPGVKISLRAFGKDRRFPITNLFKNS